MFVLPRSRNNEDGHAVCSCYYGAMRSSNAGKAHSKFSLVNVFLAGCIPETIKHYDKDNKKHVLVTRDEDFSDLMRLFLAHVRSFGFIHTDTKGQHKFIMGHYHFLKLTSHTCVEWSTQSKAEG